MVFSLRTSQMDMAGGLDGSGAIPVSVVACARWAPVAAGDCPRNQNRRSSRTLQPPCHAWPRRFRAKGQHSVANRTVTTESREVD
jgi:hypothetical protein